MMVAIGAMSRMKLKLSLSYSVALIALGGVTNRSVWPSAGALHHRFRGDIAARAWSVLGDERLAQPLREPLSMSRANRSVPPPGGNGTIRRTGRDG